MPNELDERRIDLLLQYALLKAAEEDSWYDHELGPIHLLKYVYLGDVAYAERHEGRTFTGAPWQFYHFGPWAPVVHDRIEPALAAIGAERRSVQNARYGDDFIRFKAVGDIGRLRDAIETDLPFGVTNAIGHAVHEFGGETSALLRHVYLTAPMVRAAPGEPLTFSPRPSRASETPADVEAPVLSAKQRRHRREALSALKANVRAGLRERALARRAPVLPAPRYDELFAAGTEWLDAMAGEPVEPVQGELTVSNDVWKSPTRRDPDVP